MIEGAQSILIAALFLVLGWLVADALLGRSGNDALHPWGLALLGLEGYALGAMMLHIATRGFVFANPWLTRSITSAVFIALGWRKLLGIRAGRAGTANRPAALVAAILVVACVLVWGSVVARSSLTFGGDTNLHAGWTSQLLNGEATPSGTLTGAIPNFYPWLFHATSALVARFTPGGTAFHALAPMQLLLPAGTTLALFELGRALTRRTVGGAAAAVFGSLTGGFGFLLVRGFDVVLDPRSNGLAYGGDLLFKRSYNVSFIQLAPPLPRDVALAMLISFLLLLTTGLQTSSRRALVGAGAALGLAGLAGAESFFLGVGVALVAPLFSSELQMRRVLSSVLLPTAALYSLWLVPQAFSYVRLGGYINITVVGPVTLPAWAALFSWGIVTPFAVYGLITYLPRLRSDLEARVVITVVSLGAALVALSVIVETLFGKPFMSLGRPHRYWPGASLGAALLASLGATQIFEKLAARRTWLAVVLVVLVLAFALPSPVIAAVALPNKAGERGKVKESLTGGKEYLLNLMIPGPGERCTAAVPLGLDSSIWAYTGYRLVMYTVNQDYASNRSRIRWRDIEEHIVPERQRLKDNHTLIHGLGRPEEWGSLAARYGVDMVVVPNNRADARKFRSYQRLEAADMPFTLVRLSDCGA